MDFVLIGFDFLHVQVGLGTAIAVAPVVVHHAFTQAVVGGFLLGLDDRGVNLHAARINLLRESFGSDLARHFGDVLGVDSVAGQFALDDQRLLQGGGVLGFGRCNRVRACGAAHIAGGSWRGSD